jgi:hypothetical protein
MSEEKTHYIYIIRTRESKRLKEDIYKIGKTQQEPHKRMNGYSKGCEVFLVRKVINCNVIEKSIMKCFDSKYENITEHGREYYSGNMQDMIKDINRICDEECDKTLKTDDILENSDEEHIDEEHIDEEHYKELYQITTYEEWVKYNNIQVIITRKKGSIGFLRFQGQLWRELHDKNSFNFNPERMEDLLGFIDKNQKLCYKLIMPPSQELFSWREMRNKMYNYKNKATEEVITEEEYSKLNVIEAKNYTFISKEKDYKFIEPEYNCEKILEDTVKKCYSKTYSFYNLEYHEYVFPTTHEEKTTSRTEYVVFNSKSFTFTPVDQLINNKILTQEKCGGRCVFIKNNINIDIVDSILTTLITPQTKAQYKNLMRNLIVKSEEENIFYDYNECLLSEWTTDILYTIGNGGYITSKEFYGNKADVKRSFKTEKPRLVLIRTFEKMSIKKQITDFSKLGFRNMIVCQNDKQNSMYNVINFRKYLQDSKDLLMKYIKEENNYKPECWANEIKYDNDIFYSSKLLFTNFLKWCCTGSDKHVSSIYQEPEDNDTDQ